MNVSTAGRILLVAIASIGLSPAHLHAYGSQTPSLESRCVSLHRPEPEAMAVFRVFGRKAQADFEAIERVRILEVAPGVLVTRHVLQIRDAGWNTLSDRTVVRSYEVRNGFRYLLRSSSYEASGADAVNSTVPGPHGGIPLAPAPRLVGPAHQLCVGQRWAFPRLDRDRKAVEMDPDLPHHDPAWGLGRVVAVDEEVNTPAGRFVTARIETERGPLGSDTQWLAPDIGLVVLWQAAGPGSARALSRELLEYHAAPPMRVPDENALHL